MTFGSAGTTTSQSIGQLPLQWPDVGAVLVAAHEDDLPGAEQLCGDHRAISVGGQIHTKPRSR
jgi:hypothetical protein